jgi:N-acetylglucosaminyldiphosphoundecaprenol N-acetyl-beta-D-mannosaminyltransferase
MASPYQPLLPILPQVSQQPSSFSVLRSTIHAVQIEDVKEIFERWISARERSHYVAVCNVHVIMEAYNDKNFRNVLASADLAVPDGMPLIWAGRRLGFRLPRRVYGPDLFLEFSRATASKGYKHFLCGGHPGVPERVAAKLEQSYPGLQVAGTCAPPFGKHSKKEQEELLSRINKSGADVLWVAFGCPKQELWMYENRDRLNVPVVVGVGQAFDIVADRVPQAPRWARNAGLEWAFRLAIEPRRLWRRYLIYNTQFVLCTALEEMGMLPARRATTGS